MSVESGEVHDWPPVTSAHASRGQPDATRSLAVRPVASIQSAKLTVRTNTEDASPKHSQQTHSTRTSKKKLRGGVLIRTSSKPRGNECTTRSEVARMNFCT